MGLPRDILRTPDLVLRDILLHSPDWVGLRPDMEPLLRSPVPEEHLHNLLELLSDSPVQGELLHILQPVGIPGLAAAGAGILSRVEVASDILRQVEAGQGSQSLLGTVTVVHQLLANGTNRKIIIVQSTSGLVLLVAPDQQISWRL